jgi:hypothetical protein
MKDRDFASLGRFGLVRDTATAVHESRRAGFQTSRARRFSVHSSRSSSSPLFMSCRSVFAAAPRQAQSRLPPIR